MSLKDKVAIVTGASSGIGAAIAIKFSEEGAKVVMVARNQSKLDNVEKKVKEVGGTPLIINADVSIEEDAKRIINETIKHHGNIDILVNNAGIGKITKITDEDVLKHYDSVMNTNFRAVIHLMHLATPHLIKTKGNIINISSIAATNNMGGNYTIYCASKAAVDSASRSVARQLGIHGVRVNTINPGPVKTDIMANHDLDPETLKYYKENAKKIVAEMTLLERASEPEEIADLAVFVASDKAKCITGSSFFADNGAKLKIP